jgi:hypothetical protein
MNQQITLGLLAIAFGLIVTGLLGAMVRYEARSGKSLYWFGPGFQLTRQSNPTMFRLRLIVAASLLAACALLTIWFAVRLFETLNA